MKPDQIKPSQRRRYEFIEFQLMWEGTIGRRLIQEKFEISPQQATLDLTAYLDLAPKNMVYDTRQRTYTARSNFRPIFIKGETSEYLLHLEMFHQGYRAAEEIWPAHIPHFDAVAVESRQIAPSVLKTVLAAIRSQSCVELMYVSLSSESGEPRQLYPHAIACDGHRWHIRAFDNDNKRYSDFVLSRVETIKLLELEAPERPDDVAWLSYVTLCMQPAPGLSERKRKRLEFEYAMKDGVLTLKVRQAMLFYYLRSYGFNPHDSENGKIRNKSSFSLSIVNLDEIEESLERRS